MIIFRDSTRNEFVNIDKICYVLRSEQKNPYNKKPYIITIHFNGAPFVVWEYETLEQRDKVYAEIAEDLK